jgi:hypothetical protein
VGNARMSRRGGRGFAAPAGHNMTAGPFEPAAAADIPFATAPFLPVPGRKEELVPELSSVRRDCSSPAAGELQSPKMGDYRVKPSSAASTSSGSVSRL